MSCYKVLLLNTLIVSFSSFSGLQLAITVSLFLFFYFYPPLRVYETLHLWEFRMIIADFHVVIHYCSYAAWTYLLEEYEGACGLKLYSDLLVFHCSCGFRFIILLVKIINFHYDLHLDSLSLSYEPQQWHLKFHDHLFNLSCAYFILINIMLAFKDMTTWGCDTVLRKD